MSLNADEIAEEEIVERIFDAVVEQRLPPGTKLSESALCEAFGVGRMRIRRSLLLLASREVVELRANRGAYVASPSAEQAREVFEARLALEPAIAHLAFERATPADFEALAQHLRQEHDANLQGRRHEAIRLSGQFHLWIAEQAAHATLGRVLTELVSSTSLILMTFGPPPNASYAPPQAATTAAACGCNAHRALVDAIALRIPQEAERLMLAHLHEIERSLVWQAVPSAKQDLQSLLGI